MTTRLRSLLNAATRSLPAKCVTSATLGITGDALSQHVIESRSISDHDYRRTARMGVYGGFIFAPIMHVWFGFLGRIRHPNIVIQTAMRVGVDQCTAGPLFPAMFFTSMTLLEGGTMADVRAKLKAAWFDTWKVGFVVFTPASIINQSIIPLSDRVLFINSIALGWNTYLSYTNSRQARTLTAQKDAASALS
ncbi:hypothetical protein CBS101457_004973 [Exobasidium rhododendri]|nr:hypothetical protein CBS101457_004973 [Exobasidium rhododendri]